jgi:ribosome biogenesis GTPase A
MAKAKRKINESLNLVDVVVEILDARAPLSSKNPDIDVLAKNKKRVIILNKADLADENVNKAWQAHFESQDTRVIMANSVKGVGLNEVYPASQELMREKIESMKKRGRIFVPIRAVIVGIPNVGKSTLINRLAGKTMAKTGDRPGVTKSNQWIKVKKDFELLDTPGILWPKFEDRQAGLNLAFTGAVNDEIIDMRNLACELISAIRVDYKSFLEKRYGITIEDEHIPETVLDMIGRARGFLLKGGVTDLNRAAIILIDEFRSAGIGRISLERPE